MSFFLLLLVALIAGTIATRAGVIAAGTTKPLVTLLALTFALVVAIIFLGLPPMTIDMLTLGWLGVFAPSRFGSATSVVVGLSGVAVAISLGAQRGARSGLARAGLALSALAAMFASVSFFDQRVWFDLDDRPTFELSWDKPAVLLSRACQSELLEQKTPAALHAEIDRRGSGRSYHDALIYVPAFDPEHPAILIVPRAAELREKHGAIFCTHAGGTKVAASNIDTCAAAVATATASRPACEL